MMANLLHVSLVTHSVKLVLMETIVILVIPTKSSPLINSVYAHMELCNQLVIHVQKFVKSA